MKQFLQNEREQYDLMNVDDLRRMYPEYAPNDEEYALQKKEYNPEDARDEELEMDFTREYEIDKEELIYQTQLRKQQNLFMKQIKKDIIKKIPGYWQKRLSFRDKSNELVNRMHNKDKDKHKNKLVVKQHQASYR